MKLFWSLYLCSCFIYKDRILLVECLSFKGARQFSIWLGAKILTVKFILVQWNLRLSNLKNLNLWFFLCFQILPCCPNLCIVGCWIAFEMWNMQCNDFSVSKTIQFETYLDYPWNLMRAFSTKAFQVQFKLYSPKALHGLLLKCIFEMHLNC